MFVDASALVALLKEEPEGKTLADRLDAVADCFTSPLAIYEAALAIRRNLHRPPAVIQADISTPACASLPSLLAQRSGRLSCSNSTEKAPGTRLN